MFVVIIGMRDKVHEVRFCYLLHLAGHILESVDWATAPLNFSHLH